VLTVFLVQLAVIFCAAFVTLSFVIILAEDLAGEHFETHNLSGGRPICLVPVCVGGY